MSTTTRGSIACVGLGMTLGSHLTPLARSHITGADVVFVAASNGVVERWVMGMNDDVRSLQRYYAEGKSRLITYREMVEAMMTEVRKGRRVCGAFYGHPGVFALAPHRVIAKARDEGFAATMVPGISAEDCLIADLGLDPGKTGCVQFEASQLLLFHRQIDTAALLILWQVGIVGDPKFNKYQTGTAQRKLLLERLLRDYPADHPVILYEAMTLPVGEPRAERLRLDEIVDASLGLETTMVVPPVREMERDEATRRQMDALVTL